ncbi:MAG: hypothetical protein WC511_02905 [Candidatus Pacearchaeota archaeon]
MNKNLFMESFSYLGVNDPPEEEKIDVPVTPKNDVIYLGAGKTFTDPLQAYQYLLTLPTEKFPKGYRCTISKSFLNSSEENQIGNLFKDWKRYREAILPKIENFFVFIKTSEAHTQSKKYISFLFSNKTPKDIDTYRDNAVDLIYFKFFVLFKFYSENRSIKK